jgi:hypothetical protein
MYDGTAAVRKAWHRTVFTGTTTDQLLTPSPASELRGDST